MTFIATGKGSKDESGAHGSTAKKMQQPVYLNKKRKPTDKKLRKSLTHTRQSYAYRRIHSWHILYTNWYSRLGEEATTNTGTKYSYTKKLTICIEETLSQSYHHWYSVRVSHCRHLRLARRKSRRRTKARHIAISIEMVEWPEQLRLVTWSA